MKLKWPDLQSSEPEMVDTAIRPFGFELRQLLWDLATPLADRCIVGLSFRVAPEEERLMFSEVRNADQKSPFLEEAETEQFTYRVAGDDEFVALMEKAEKGQRQALAEMQKPHDRMMLRPLMTVFGDMPFSAVFRPEEYTLEPEHVRKTLSDLFVEAFLLSESAAQGCTLYIVYRDLKIEENSAFRAQIQAMSLVRPLVANLVRQAVFFAAATTHGEIVEKLQATLTALLPDEMEVFGSRQRAFLQGMLHPVFHSSLVPSADKPELKGFPNGVSVLPYEAIKNAATITFEGPLEGSLRGAGAPILVKILPRHDRSHGKSGPLPYRAVVKTASRSEVIREQRGLTRLWGYYEKAGRFLPQSPLHFPYEESDGTVRFSTMTPHVGRTVTLYDKARTGWNSKDFPRQAFFSSVISDIARFIESIGKSTTHNISPATPLHDALSPRSGRPKRRRDKLLREMTWPTCLPHDTPLLTIHGFPSEYRDTLTLVNPRWIVQQIDRDSQWALNRYAQVQSVNGYVYSHGDLHCGNVLVESVSSEECRYKRMVVLDFDYVAPAMSEHTDTATLECSFLMSVFHGLGPCSTEAVWADLIVPTLMVRWKPDEFTSLVENNRFAYDLDYVLNFLPFSLSRCPSRSACRASALLRLLASHYIREKEERKLADATGMLWSAWLMAAMCLTDLFPPETFRDEKTELELSNIFETTWT